MLYKLAQPFIVVISHIINTIMPYSWIDTLYSYEITSNFSIRKRETDFDKVLEFNTLFNVPQVSANNTPEENNNIIRNGFALITEEFQELETAIEQQDKIEVKDALCDLVYVIYGLLYRIKMTSNAKLNNIALNFSLSNNHYDNPFNNLYTIISANVYKDMKTYIQVYSNINKYMSCGKKLNVVEQFNELTSDNIFTMYNNMNTLQHLRFLIKNVEKNINLGNKISYGYTEYALTYTLVDLLLAVYSVGELSFDFASNFDIVHRSNMSKICSSEVEAKATVSSYFLRYNAGEVPYDSPYYERIAENKWMVRNRSTQKVLKNINYKPVEEFPEWLE